MISGRTGKTSRERDSRILEKMCGMIALLTIFCCLLFLSGMLQYVWVLRGAMILGVLMNFAAVPVLWQRGKSPAAAAAVLLMLADAGAFLFFTIE